MIRTSAAAGFAVVAALIAGQAQAHAKLVKADPGDKASIAAPKTLHLTFSEKVEPKLSGAQLMKANGDNVPVKSVANGKMITATPNTPLAPGGYMVMWYAVAADDGHRTNGEYNFVVK